MSLRAIVIYCGLLMTVGAFSIDSTLPAFPHMARDFSTSWDRVQLTVSVFMLVAAGGQLVVGAFADRFGRRPVILAGLGIYCLGALLSAAAGSIEVMLAGRAMQGLGAAVGWVLARAILRDLHSGGELARAMAFASAVFAFGPIVAPLTGAALMLAFPWQVIFAMMLAFALLLLATCLFALPETLARVQADALSPRRLAANAVAMVADPQSRFFLLVAGAAHAMMLLVIVGLPRVYEESFGVSGPVFAAFFAVHGIDIVIGQVANHRLIARWGTLAAMRIGATVLFAVAAGMVLLAAQGWLDAWRMSALFIVFATSFLIVYSNTAALALDPHGRIAGFASSFFGFFSQIVSGSVAVLAAPAIGGSALRFAVAIGMLSGGVLLALQLRASRPA